MAFSLNVIYNLLFVLVVYLTSFFSLVHFSRDMKEDTINININDYVRQTSNTLFSLAAISICSIAGKRTGNM